MNGIIFLIFAIFFSTFSFAQHGKLLSKELVDISQTPAWNYISENDTLKSDFKHLNKLNFYSITYQSDSLKIKGLLVEPKKDGKYPVVITE